MSSLVLVITIACFTSVEGGGGDSSAMEEEGEVTNSVISLHFTYIFAKEVPSHVGISL
jgi:hypothetical protein